MRYFISSESVNCGHPDKTCDIIADSFLDEALRQDAHSQMAVECAIKDNHLFIYGEATTNATIDYESIARGVLADIGYDAESFEITKVVSSQSPELTKCVVQDELCANDQGMMYGFATNETPELMPMPIIVAHKLMKAFDDLRREHTKVFHADAKAQVTVEYEDGRPIRIDTVLMSVSHVEGVEQDKIQSIIANLISFTLTKDYAEYFDEGTKMIINPSGSFSIWGSHGDSGCTGRKIIVDKLNTVHFKSLLIAGKCA